MSLSTPSFISDDYRKAFFPLSSNSFFSLHGENELRTFINREIFSASEGRPSFLRSSISYALKDKLHIRRVMQLDPVSLFFIYDFINRNRDNFKSRALENRFTYGYRFERGLPIPSFAEYHKFRSHKYKLKSEYEYFIKVDIANCFNSFYHHDISSHIKETIGEQEGSLLGRFLREINGGNSINFFPQGIYPAKAIGNKFLSFVEESRELRSSAILRFLDDIYLFSNDINLLEKDVYILQHLLADRGLFLNAQKTVIGSKNSDFDEKKLDEIKISLLQKRQKEEDSDDDEFEGEGDNDEIELSEEEREYLYALINAPDIEEEDAELALSLLKEDPDAVTKLAELVVHDFPNLTKNLYKVFLSMNNPEEYFYLFRDKIEDEQVHEFELFWITRIVLDHFSWSSEKADFLIDVYNDSSTPPTVKAAILEDEQLGYGLIDMKRNIVESGGVNICSFAAVAGLNKMEKGRRNQLYKYAASQSPIMKVLCGIASKT